MQYRLPVGETGFAAMDELVLGSLAANTFAQTAAAAGDEGAHAGYLRLSNRYLAILHQDITAYRRERSLRYVQFNKSGQTN